MRLDPKREKRPSLGEGTRRKRGDLRKRENERVEHGKTARDRKTLERKRKQHQGKKNCEKVQWRSPVAYSLKKSADALGEGKKVSRKEKDASGKKKDREGGTN